MLNLSSSAVASGAAALLEPAASAASAAAELAAPRARRAADAPPPSIPLRLEPAGIASPGAVATVLGRAARVDVPGWAGSSPATSAAARTSSSPAKTSSSAAKTSPAASSSGSALAFLSDAKLSIEEKLIRLLSYLNGRWEKEMEAKMKALAGDDGGKTASTSATKKTTSASSATTTKKKGGGLLGSIGSAISGALKIPDLKSAVKKVGTPVLAAAASALGFPAAAPLILKYGPTVVDGVADAVSAAKGGSGGSGSGTSSSGTGSSSGASGSKAASDADRQGIMLELQRLQQKQSEMFGLVSNFLRASHETRMVAINNIR